MVHLNDGSQGTHVSGEFEEYESAYCSILSPHPFPMVSHSRVAVITFWVVPGRKII